MGWTRQWGKATSWVPGKKDTNGGAVTGQSFTKTGFLQSDMNIFEEGGSRLTRLSSEKYTPPTQQTMITSQQLPSGFMSGASQEDVDTMTGVFAARLEAIRNKRLQPGIALQTRGER